jgi:hypothetical protein
MTPAFCGAAIALLGLFTVASPARADVFPLCPSAGTTGGDGTGTFTYVPGPLDGTCGANSAVEMSIPNAVNYAKLTFSSTTAGYPAGLTLGGLSGLSAGVTLDAASDQPYYELAFTDLSDSLGQTAATDQILLIEFQTPTVSGGDLDLNPTSTLFNLYDNTSGMYLQGGQADAKTLATWLADFSSLSSEDVQQIRIGLGLAGGSGPAESVTVNSLDITTAVPEPTSILLLFTVAGATLLSARRKQSRARNN